LLGLSENSCKYFFLGRHSRLVYLGYIQFPVGLVLRVCAGGGGVLMGQNLASVKFREYKNGVVEASYIGVVRATEFEGVRREVLGSVTDAVAILFLADAGTVVLNEVPEVPEIILLRGSPPGAVVVEPEQFRLWLDYANKLSKVGVIRGIFLPNEMVLAQQFVDRLARLRRRGLL
jgi:hypothetical protein